MHGGVFKKLPVTVHHFNKSSVALFLPRASPQTAFNI